MHFEKLPRGITGFSGRHSRIEAIDPAKFKAAGYQAAIRMKGTVEAFDAELHRRNYYALTVRAPSNDVSVLCNAAYPAIGFVAARAYGFTDLTFIDGAAVGRIFAEVGSFEVLDVEFLTRDLRPEHISDLAPEEVDEIRHWQRNGLASRVGDVIFNSWD
jgi:hypothetical protein